MKEKLQNLLNQSLSSLVVNGTISALPAKIRIDHTKDQKHGDYATNVALILGKQNKCSPTELAKVIIEQLDESEFIEKMEIAGPGFINFFLSEESNVAVVNEIIRQGDSYGMPMLCLRYARAIPCLSLCYAHAIRMLCPCCSHAMLVLFLCHAHASYAHAIPMLCPCYTSCYAHAILFSCGANAMLMICPCFSHAMPMLALCYANAIPFHSNQPSQPASPTNRPTSKPNKYSNQASKPTSL